MVIGTTVILINKRDKNILKDHSSEEKKFSFSTDFFCFGFMQDTYGTYAELRHKAEEMVNELKETTDEGNQGSDIMAQRDYMDTVSRNYAKRLERRRNLVITSVRFHRLAEDVSSPLLTLLSVFNDRLVSNIYVHVLLKIVGNPVCKIQITFISCDLLRSCYLVFICYILKLIG